MWCVYLTKNKTSTYLGHLRMRSHLLSLREISPAKFQYKSARSERKSFRSCSSWSRAFAAFTNTKLVYSYIATDGLFCPRNFVEISLMWPHLHTLRYLKTDTLYFWQKWQRQHRIVVYAESDFENAFYMKSRRKSCLIRAGLRVVSSYLSHTLLVRNAFTWSMLL